MVEEVDREGGGVWEVTTSSGTVHVIDLDNRTLTRFGARGHEWLGAGMGLGPVTPDEVPFHFLEISPIRLGESITVDGLREWRVTTPVQKIERLE